MSIRVESSATPAIPTSASSAAASKKISIVEEIFTSEAFQNEIKDIQFDAIPYHTKRLDNGLTIYYYAHREEKAKGNYATIKGVVRVGFNDEHRSRFKDKDLRQMAHFLEHCVFHAQSKQSADALHATLSSLGCPVGADSNASTGATDTCYDIKNVPLENPENFKKAVDVIYQLLFCATFPEAIMGERIPVCCEMQDSLEYAFKKHLREHVFPDVVKGIHNELSENLFSKYSYEELRETMMQFYKEFYRPDNIAIICVSSEYNKEEFDHLCEVFSRPKQEDHPLWQEPLPVREHTPFTPSFGASEIEHCGLKSSFVAVYQRQSRRKKDLKALTHPSVQPKKIAKRIIREEISFLFAKMKNQVMTEGKGKDVEHGLVDIIFSGSASLAEAVRWRITTICVEEGRMGDALPFAFQKIWNLSADVASDERLALAKKYIYTVLARAKEAPVTQGYFVSLLTNHFLEGRSLTAKETEYELRFAACKVITALDVQRYWLDYMTPFKAGKVDSIHMVTSIPINRRQLTSAQVGETFRSFFESDKPAPVAQSMPKQDILIHDNLPVVSPVLKKHYEGRVTEYQYANGVRVLLNPCDDKSEIYAKVNFNLLPCVVGPDAKRFDYLYISAALKMYALFQGYGLDGHLPFSELAQRENINVGTCDVTKDDIEFTAILKDLNNQEMFFNMLHTCSQPHRFSDIEKIRLFYGKYTEGVVKQNELRQNNSNERFQIENVTALSRDSSISCNILEMDLKKTLTYENFYRSMRLVFDNLPPPVFVLSGRFDVEAIEPLLDKYLGTLSYPERKDLKRTPTAFPAGVLERTITCQGDEGVSKTKINFPLPRNKKYKDELTYKAASILLSTFFNDRMRFDGDQQVYNVGVHFSSESESVLLNPSYFSFELKCPTNRHEEVIKAFWAAFDSFHAMDDEEKTRRIHVVHEQFKKAWDIQKEGVGARHNALCLLVQNKYSIEEFENFFKYDVFNEGLTQLIDSLLQRDNYFSVTMHTKEKPE